MQDVRFSESLSKKKQTSATVLIVIIPLHKYPEILLQGRGSVVVQVVQGGRSLNLFVETIVQPGMYFHKRKNHPQNTVIAISLAVPLCLRPYPFN